MTGLRSLELAQVEPFDLAVVRDLPELRRLVVQQARDTDLNPLSGHPRLADLDIESRRITGLPEPLPPSLRALTLSSPELRAEQLTGLRARAPGARIRGDWNQVLVEEVACATQVRILPGCGCWGCACVGCPCPGCVCRAKDGARPIEITDPAAIQAMLPLMAVEPEAVDTPGHGGSTTIEFLRGHQLVASVEIDVSEAHAAPQHPPLLRWFTAGRAVSRRLPDAHRDALCAWLAGHSAADVCAMKAASP